MKHKYANYSVNGYSWFGFYDDFHHFSKLVSWGKYAYIKLLDLDMRNGNSEYMLEHDLSR